MRSQLNQLEPQLIRMLPTTRSNNHSTLHSLDLIFKQTHVPLPTHLSTFPNTLTNCFANVCGVTTSPASCSTHTLLQRLNSSNTHLTKKNGAIQQSLISPNLVLFFGLTFVISNSQHITFSMRLTYSTSNSSFEDLQKKSSNTKCAYVNIQSY